MFGKDWWMSTTIRVGLLEILLGIVGLVVDQLSTGEEWTALAVLAIVSGTLKLILRKITTEPIKPLRGS